MSWECGCGITNKNTVTKCRGCGVERAYELRTRLAETPEEGELRERARRKVRTLRVALVVYVASFALVMLLFYEVVPGKDSNWPLLFFLISCVADCTCIISITSLAGILGRSKIKWFGLVVLTGMFGPIIGYFSIKDKAENFILGINPSPPKTGLTS